MLPEIYRKLQRKLNHYIFSPTPTTREMMSDAERMSMEDGGHIWMGQCRKKTSSADAVEVAVSGSNIASDCHSAH